MKPPVAINLYIILNILLLFSSAESHGKVKALLVGVGNYPLAANKLEGPPNDIAIFSALLKSKFNTDEENITKLVDAHATCKKIIAAFEAELVNGLGEDDVAIFYYSGHGSFVPDLNGDERDKFDEILCPFDINARDVSTWLTDDILYNLIRRVKAGRILVVLDCCHSGTGTRGVELPPKWNERKDLSHRFMPLVFEKSDFLTAGKRLADRANEEPDNHILIAACKDDEIALEFNFSGKRCGLLTKYLCDALSHIDRDTSFSDLDATVSVQVEKFSREQLADDSSQNPSFEGKQLKNRVVDFLFSGPKAK